MVLFAKALPLLHQAQLHCFVKSVSSKLRFFKRGNGAVPADLLELFQLQEAAAICIIVVKCKSCSFSSSKRVENVNCQRISSDRTQEELFKIQLVVSITVYGIEEAHQIGNWRRFIVLHQSNEVAERKKVGLIARLCGKSVKSSPALCLLCRSCLKECQDQPEMLYWTDTSTWLSVQFRKEDVLI